MFMDEFWLDDAVAQDAGDLRDVLLVEVDREDVPVEDGRTGAKGVNGLRRQLSWRTVEGASLGGEAAQL